MFHLLWRTITCRIHQDGPTKLPGGGAGKLPSSVTGNQSLTPPAAGSSSAPNYYVVSTFSGKLTVNQVSGQETYVAIRVNGGDITGGITVNPGYT